MRLTVLDNDQGECISPGREYITVYHNGEEVKHCLSADDVTGEVVSVETDDKGRMLSEDGEVKRRTLYGCVRIVRQTF